MDDSIPEGTGTHLPESPVEAGVGALHDGQGHGRRSAAFLAEQTDDQQSDPEIGSPVGRRSCNRRRHRRSSDAPSPRRRRPRTSQPIKIVPKGLRSFDAHDADFFLELLPGPRDRDGLPDSIRFWKTRIEETDADNTFSVGLIYGPSGCGKSSLVKAGLLPRLSENVIAVYVEATAEETETRLLNGLRKRCPALPDNLGLKETLAALRRGQGIPAGKKVLIVLDQFEQWLHAKKEEENTELVQALRQCDGGRVQCIVMVRDDFWMAVTRFMRELEVRLVEGQNSAAVDLFPIRPRRESAGGVWAGLRRTCPRIPARPARNKKQFLEQAVSGLAQEGKVICVRLALFAEMMKGKPWTPATLKEVGGTEGVGVTFLEETFSAATAPPRTPLSPESGQGRAESPAARIRHRHQGPHAVACRIAGGIGLCQPSQGFRRPDPHSRQRNPAHHADRPRRQGRGSDSVVAGPSRCRNTTNSPTTIWCRRCGTG